MKFLTTHLVAKPFIESLEKEIQLAKRQGLPLEKDLNYTQPILFWILSYLRTSGYKITQESTCDSVFYRLHI